MMPERYQVTATTISGGESVTGNVIFEGRKAYIKTPGVCTESSRDELINANFVGFYAQRVDPSTITSVAVPVLRERTLVGNYRCPNCRAAFIEDFGTTNFCGNCGQALDWSEA